ncbi:MAG: hypothetical protein ACLT98_00325 [Eggerthellaceae bacterium]
MNIIVKMHDRVRVSRTRMDLHSIMLEDDFLGISDYLNRACYLSAACSSPRATTCNSSSAP